MIRLKYPTSNLRVGEWIRIQLKKIYFPTRMITSYRYDVCIFLIYVYRRFEKLKIARAIIPWFDKKQVNRCTAAIQGEAAMLCYSLSSHLRTKRVLLFITHGPSNMRITRLSIFIFSLDTYRNTFLRKDYISFDICKNWWNFTKCYEKISTTSNLLVHSTQITKNKLVF